MNKAPIEIKSAQRRAFDHYLRTGRLPEFGQAAAEGVKFNPWHDPRNGEFTFAPGGPKQAARTGRSPEAAGSLPTIHPPQMEVPERKLPPSPRSTPHIRAPIKTGAGNYEDYVAAKIKAGATRIWPVPGKGRPAEKNEIGPNSKPYADGRFSMTGEFRRNIDGSRRRHHGIDLPAAVGTPVLAAAGGVVEESDKAGDYGTIILIKHDDGTRAMYAHLSKRLVTAGEHIKIGQKIGHVGTSGYGPNRGSHLHFEVSDSRLSAFAPQAKLDPTEWMKKDRTR